MSLPGYSVRKAAQLVAFFAAKQGGRINVLKLSKLVYLSDREHMGRYDMPILFDKLVSMDHGPVDSLTLNHINGLIYDERPEWGQFVTDRAGHEVGLARPELGVADFDELSEAELEVLESVWAEYGTLTQYQLRDLTHKICPEWENPRGSSERIPYSRVFKFLGKDGDFLADRVDSIRSLDTIFDDGRA